MAVRVFSSGFIALDEGTTDSVLNGAFTVAALFKRSGSTTDGTQFLVSLDAGANSNERGSATIASDNTMQLSVGGFTRTFGFTISDNTWYLFVAKKASGTATPRANLYNFSTAAWAGWANGSGTLSNDGTTLVEARLGNGPGSFPLNGKMAAAAVYAAALSDAECETLAVGMPNWQTLGPAALWRLNQASTATAVTDETGNGATQTSTSGTTVDTGDDPAGFDLVSAVFHTTNDLSGAGEFFENAGLNLGQTYVFYADGTVSHIRFRAPALLGGTYTGAFYQVTAHDPPAGSGGGTLLGQAAFSSMVADTWSTVALPSPVAVTANTAYRAVVFSSVGRYRARGTFFQIGYDRGNVHAVVDNQPTAGFDLHQGVFFVAGSLTYPKDTFNATAYFIDTVYQPGGVVAPDYVRPTILTSRAAVHRASRW